MNYPISIDYMPDMNLKLIKKPIYEGYAAVSEKSILKNNFVSNMIRHQINEFRTRNFFVKRIYYKYRVIANGVTIIAFELVRLRDPIVERLLK